MQKLILVSLLAVLPYLGSAKDSPTAPPGSKKLHFLENKGQIKNQDKQPRNDVQFSVNSKGTNIFIGNGEIHYQFSKVDNPEILRDNSSKANIKEKIKNLSKATTSLHRMDVTLLGANKNAQVVTEQQQEFVTRFYEMAPGKKLESIAPSSLIEANSYDKITYKNIYPNIDWVIYAKDNELEYDFVVRPGGKVSDIKIKYSGTNSLTVNKDGSLTATTPFGSVKEHTPYTFQANGKKVNSSFNLEGDVISFNVDKYEGTLTIDPTLTWGTYYGFTGEDEYAAVTNDFAGNVYATGYTTSSSFIATDATTYLGGFNGYDGFVSRFNAAGVLQWTTYVNTTGDDYAFTIATDGGSGLYVGLTIDVGGDYDAFLARMTTGGIVNSSIYWGDIGNDYANTVTCDNSANVYFGGSTESTTNISVPGAYQLNLSGVQDGFLAKINSAGTVLWSTYYGGTGGDNVNGLCADLTGNLYVTGATNSTASMATTGTTQTIYGGGNSDVYLAQFNASTGVRNWGTYIGGSNDEDFGHVDIAPVGGIGIYVTGTTNSTNAIATNGTAQTTFGGIEDAFLVKYSTSGVKTWGTYYGGAGDDAANAITVDQTGVFIAGGTSGSLVTTNGYQTTYGGGTVDGFIAKFTDAGGLLVWGSYYGGSDFDRIDWIDADNASSLYVCGPTASLTGIATLGSEQPNNLGGTDAFLSKFCDNPILNGPITGSNSVCANSTETYSVPAASGATSYTWTLPTGWTGTSTTNSITANVGTTGGTISVTANNSCGSSTAQTLNVTVNPIPTANITAGGPTTFCQGGSVVLTATSGTGYSYQWYQGTTQVGTNSNTYTANASGSYTVEITANGCDATSNAITVTVNPNPATPTAGANVPCVGQTLNLTASSTTSGVTYDWTGPNNFSNTQNPSITNVQASDAGVYTVTVTLNGCSASAQVTATVAPGAPATPGPITGNLSICEGSTETYTVPNDVNVGTYSWSLPTGWTGSSTTNSINAIAGASGGTITVTGTNGCGSTTSAPITVTVNPLPTPTITQSGNTLSTTSTYTSYQWYNSSGPISGQTGQSYTPTTSGDYYVVVTDGNGCSNQSNTITITLGVNNVSKSGNVSLYPNPNDGNFTIKGSFNSLDGKVNIEVVDIAGRIVHKEQMTVKGNEVNKAVNMNVNLAPGVYTLKLSSDVANAVVPFVKK